MHFDKQDKVDSEKIVLDPNRNENENRDSCQVEAVAVVEGASASTSTSTSTSVVFAAAADAAAAADSHLATCCYCYYYCSYSFLSIVLRSWGAIKNCQRSFLRFFLKVLNGTLNIIQAVSVFLCCWRKNLWLVVSVTLQ